MRTQLFHDKLETLFPLVKAFGNHELWLVGGCVRDMILNREPKDFDFATDAEPEVITKIMKKLGASIVEKNGGNYGTVHCIYKGEQLEITTFRANESYERGNRRPKVNFSKNLSDDLVRRDFTCNAIAAYLCWDPTYNYYAEVNISDSTSLEGYSCLDRPSSVGLLRTPIDASTSFSDDPLRILRAYRFKHRLGFVFDDNIRPAIRQWAPYLKEISWERIHDELVQIAGTRTAALAFREMMEDGVITHIIPELVSQLGYDQDNYHHHLPLWEHTLLAVENAVDLGASYRVVLACLLHDVAKPTSFQIRYKCIEDRCDYKSKLPGDVYDKVDKIECPTCGSWALREGKSFLKHDYWGADMTEKILRRLKFSGEDITDITMMVGEHVNYAHGEWNIRNVRRFVNKMGHLWKEHIQLMVSDRLAHSEAYRDVEGFAKLEVMISQLDTSKLIGEAVKTPIDGNQVAKMLGMKPGVELGAVMKEMKQLVVDGLISTVEQAEEFVLTKKPQ
jgi:poly(A) polymerase